MQKFSSNVVEKCLKLADSSLEEHRNVVVREIMTSPLLDRLLEALDVDSDTADSGESEESPEEAAATRTTRQANAAEVLVGIARGAPSALATKLSGKDALSNPRLLYTSPSPRDRTTSRMPSSA